jgi:enoyl-[acyl-carrier protein] reductase I
MSLQLLKGKRGIIFGALDENSIAWKVAEKAHEHGAKIVLTNAPIALRMGEIFKLGEKLKAEVVPADITQVDDLENLFQESMNILGGKIDFVLHSVGMSPNVRKGLHYTDLDYNYMNKTLDVSAISLHKVLQVAYKMDAMNEWGSVVALSYIAAQRTYSSYSDMAQAKAMLESIARSFGYHYGKKRKVRVNTISQSPTVTTAGTGVGGFKSFYAYAHCMSPWAMQVPMTVPIIALLCFLISQKKSPCKTFSMMGAIQPWVSAIRLFKVALPARVNASMTWLKKSG